MLSFSIMTTLITAGGFLLSAIGVAAGYKNMTLRKHENGRTNDCGEPEGCECARCVSSGRFADWVVAGGVPSDSAKSRLYVSVKHDVSPMPDGTWKGVGKVEGHSPQGFAPGDLLEPIDVERMVYGIGRGYSGEQYPETFERAKDHENFVFLGNKHPFQYSRQNWVEVLFRGKKQFIEREKVRKVT